MRAARRTSCSPSSNAELHGEENVERNRHRVRIGDVAIPIRERESNRFHEAMEIASGVVTERARVESFHDVELFEKRHRAAIGRLCINRVAPVRRRDRLEPFRLVARQVFPGQDASFAFEESDDTPTSKPTPIGILGSMASSRDLARARTLASESVFATRAQSANALVSCDAYPVAAEKTR